MTSHQEPAGSGQALKKKHSGFGVTCSTLHTTSTPEVQSHDHSPRLGTTDRSPTFRQRGPSHSAGLSIPAWLSGVDQLIQSPDGQISVTIQQLQLPECSPAPRVLCGDVMLSSSHVWENSGTLFRCRHTLTVQAGTIPTCVFGAALE